mgnify:CR=1 FL=1
MTTAPVPVGEISLYGSPVRTTSPSRPACGPRRAVERPESEAPGPLLARDRRNGSTGLDRPAPADRRDASAVAPPERSRRPSASAIRLVALRAARPRIFRGHRAVFRRPPGRPWSDRIAVPRLDDRRPSIRPSSLVAADRCARRWPPLGHNPRLAAITGPAAAARGGGCAAATIASRRTGTPGPHRTGRGFAAATRWPAAAPPGYATGYRVSPWTPEQRGGRGCRAEGTGARREPHGSGSARPRGPCGSPAPRRLRGS